MKKMKNNNTFAFECKMKHRFVLSKKQIVNGKWCNICAKTVEKLRKKVAKEELKVLNFEGSEEYVKEVRSLLAENVEECREPIEQMMIREKIEAEVEERRSLESRFQRWRRRSGEAGKTEGSWRERELIVSCRDYDDRKK